MNFRLHDYLGNIPKEIGYLSSLQVLHIDCNNLSGKLIELLKYLLACYLYCYLKYISVIYRFK